MGLTAKSWVALVVYAVVSAPESPPRRSQPTSPLLTSLRCSGSRHQEGHHPRPPLHQHPPPQARRPPAHPRPSSPRLPTSLASRRPRHSAFSQPLCSAGGRRLAGQDNPSRLSRTGVGQAPPARPRPAHCPRRRMHLPPRHHRHRRRRRPPRHRRRGRRQALRRPRPLHLAREPFLRLDLLKPVTHPAPVAHTPVRPTSRPPLTRPAASAPSRSGSRRSPPATRPTRLPRRQRRRRACASSRSCTASGSSLACSLATTPSCSAGRPSWVTLPGRRASRLRGRGR